MAYEWAKPGVRCVFKAVTVHRNKMVARLTDGQVYTIRAIFEHPTRAGVLVVRLMEVHNAENARGLERGYNIINFRPIITKTQEEDVEMFLTLLNRSPLERLDLLA